MIMEERDMEERESTILAHYNPCHEIMRVWSTHR